MSTGKIDVYATLEHILHEENQTINVPYNFQILNMGPSCTV